MLEAACERAQSVLLDQVFFRPDAKTFAQFNALLDAPTKPNLGLERLLRVRAVENLAYVLAPAQGGVHANGRHTWGHSMLVDGWGRILSERETGAGVVIGDISYLQLQQWRTQLPALAHRKTLSAVQTTV